MTASFEILDKTGKIVEIRTGRPVSLAPQGMVSCPHSLASAAGVDVLLAGGSAVDAAIATSAALSVIYPHMTGVGGDAFWLIYDSSRNEVCYLDGGGRAAASADLHWFHDHGHREIPFRGILPATLTTPGAVASWCEAHERYGNLSLERCLEAAICYASDGFPVTARLAHWIRETAPEFTQSPEWRSVFLPNNELPSAGEKLLNSDLARTLKAIASNGWAGFYQGEIAQELACFSHEHGGFLTKDDIGAQQAHWGQPLVGSYRGVTIYETPAPTQGFTVLQMLGMLEPYQLHKLEFLGADHVHLLVQAKQIAYHDRDRWLADPAFVHVPMDRLLSSDYISERRRLNG